MCCKKRIHLDCVMTWYQSQQKKHIWPTCPYCRADLPAAVLQPLGENPPPPTPVNWAAARHQSSFLRHPWDDTIPFERLFFLEFLHATLPSNVFFHQTVSGFYLTTIHRYENRRLSRFLAQTKREAIRRF